MKIKQGRQSAAEVVLVAPGNRSLKRGALQCRCSLVLHSLPERAVQGLLTLTFRVGIALLERRISE